MRSHAKASSAGSNRQQAVKLVLPASLFAVLVALVVVVGSASAANGVVNFFGGNGVEGGKFSLASGGPGGIAVNQAGSGGAGSGDVYVVDRGNNRVQQFSGAGAFVRAFGLNVGGAGVHVCDVAANCVAGTASAEAGGLSSPQGIAIDQTNGNVFISDQNNRRIDVFSANGTFQAAFGYGVDTGGAALELCTTASTCAAGSSGANAGQFGAQIGYPAIAPSGSPNAGDLYVGDKSNRRVDQFDIELTGAEVTGVTFVKGWGWGVDDGASEFQQCTTASVCQAPNTSSPTSNPGQFSANQPQAVAIDSNGNAYTAESAGNSRAQKFDASGNPAAFNGADLAGSPGPIDIAVDPTNDHVFGLKEPSGAGEKRVLELNAAGVFIATHASGTTITSANGVAVANGTTNFYVSTNQGGEYRGVFFLGTKVNPTASTEAPSPLQSHSATIKGKVNPKGFTTAYRFEFSRDKGKTWEKIPTSDIDAGNGEADVPISQEVDGLIGGHQYRYKIVATKPFGAGAATSNTTTFTTSASPPQVNTFSTAVTTSSAVLSAEINPNNQNTTYHFEYGKADCAVNPCTSIPASDAGIGSGEAPIRVAKEITGLESDTSYHFRVVATNSTGTVEGPDTVFTTYRADETDATCANGANRYGPGAFLPDCRAYELVSPVDKDGGDIRSLSNNYIFWAEINQASKGGERYTFSSYKAFGGAESGVFSNQYLASRGSDGWTTKPISAPHRVHSEYPPAELGTEALYKAFSDDLSTGWFADYSRFPLVTGGIEAFTNVYERDLGSGDLAVLTPGDLATGAQIFSEIPYIWGHTPGNSHVLFTTQAGLTPDAAGNSNPELYDYTDGEPELVSVLPNGEADPELSFPGGGKEFGGGPTHGQSGSQDHAISDDGSRIFWTSNGFYSVGGQIYVRIDGETTIAVSEEGKDAFFWTADAAGSTAIYSQYASSPGNFFIQDLYAFDVDTETRSQIAGEVLGVVGASDDLSRLYFVSREDLAGGATAGERNLYLNHEGTVEFIAGLASTDTGDSLGSADTSGTRLPAVASMFPIMRRNRLSADGRHLVFMSTKSLTGYDNTDAITGEAAFEVFSYDADDDELNCVSCNPSGARPVGRPLRLPYDAEDRTLFTGGSVDPIELNAAAWIPSWENSLYASRAMSENGDRIFFNSFDALVPRDTNGRQDVYQWEAQGTGGCDRFGGCIDLLSTGQSSGGAEFMDASASGDDVFIRTESSIDPRDTYGRDIYNVRVGGGYPPPPPPPPACVGDACQSPSSAPDRDTAASATFRGSGDPKPVSVRNCRSAAKRAARLSHRARRLRRVARRGAPGRRSIALRRRSHRLAKRAKGLSNRATRCRRANRRTKR